MENYMVNFNLRKSLILGIAMAVGTVGSYAAQPNFNYISPKLGLINTTSIQVDGSSNINKSLNILGGFASAFDGSFDLNGGVQLFSALNDNLYLVGTGKAHLDQRDDSLHLGAQATGGVIFQADPQLNLYANAGPVFYGNDGMKLYVDMGANIPLSRIISLTIGGQFNGFYGNQVLAGLSIYFN
jgi:hypothetical protein